MRVLILYLSVGSGHKVAAKSLEEGLRFKYPNIEVKTMDLVKSKKSGVMGVLPDIYKAMMGLAPNLYDSMWDSNFLKRSYKLVDDPILDAFIPRIEGIVRRFNPDLVATTHVIAAKMISHLKINNGLNIPCVNIVTDFGLHPYWLTERTNKYLVPTEDVKNELVSQGAKSGSVYTTGIPINLAYSNVKKKKELPKGLNLKKGVPNVLFISGGKTLGPYVQVIRLIKKIVLETFKISKNKFTITVVAGNNKKLIKELNDLNIPINVLGFIDFMPKLLEISTLLVAKPGGLITSEALSCKLPMIMIGKPVGQERENANFLIRQGVGIKLVSDKGIPKLIEVLLKDKTRLNSMRAKAKKLGKPNAALDAADEVFNLRHLTLD